MPKHLQFYGDNPDPNADPTFKPSGEPDKRDNRGSIEGSGVPASQEQLSAEPDVDAGPSSQFEAGPVTVVRRATSEKSQPIDKPIANPDIVGGSAEASSVEPGAK